MFLSILTLILLNITTALKGISTISSTSLTHQNFLLRQPPRSNTMRITNRTTQVIHINNRGNRQRNRPPRAPVSLLTKKRLMRSRPAIFHRNIRVRISFTMCNSQHPVLIQVLPLRRLMSSLFNISTFARISNRVFRSIIRSNLRLRLQNRITRKVRTHRASSNPVISVARLRYKNGLHALAPLSTRRSLVILDITKACKGVSAVQRIHSNSNVIAIISHSNPRLDLSRSNHFLNYFRNSSKTRRRHCIATCPQFSNRTTR